MSIKLKPIEQQVIVITGASSGIGLATAREVRGTGPISARPPRSGDGAPVSQARR